MRRRLLLVALATTSLLVVAFAVPLALLVRSVAEDRAVSGVTRDAAALTPILAVTGDRSALATAVERTASGGDGRLTVWFPDGEVLGDDGRPGGAALELARRDQRSFSRRTTGGLDLFTPVVTSAGDVVVVRGFVPDELARAGVPRAWLAIGLTAVALVAAAVALADRLARRMTTDAVGLAATAAALAGGDAAARAVPGETPELAEAGRALNQLADRIDELRAVERERVADLSHRLRTPLTVLRLDAEARGDQELTADVDQLERAVTELVRSARRPLHGGAVRATCDAVEVLRDRAAFWGALAEDDGRQWGSDIPATTGVVAVSADELVAALDAVLGNVFAHTPSGTPYSVAAEVTDDEVRLVVADDGPGIGDPDRALDRGATGSPGRPSTGLGLDIAATSARTAGGALTVAAAPGGGTAVTWSAPRA